MTSQGAPSLRDLYNNPSSSWSFVPVVDNNGNGASSSSTSASPAEASSYQWSSRNSLYDISSGIDIEPSSLNVSIAVRGAAMSALLVFFSTAVEIPWEVGKTLLQVQYVPREAHAVEEPEEVTEEEPPSEDELSADNDDAYFADEDGSSSRVNTPRPTDDRGYVIRQSVSDSSTRASYVIPLGTANGVWAMIKQVARWKPEGWLGLWKGLATTCLHNILLSKTQPVVRSILAAFFGPSNARSFSRPHVLSDFILSPFSLIRTRLIVQTSAVQHRRYTGPFDAFNQILHMYFHPQLFFPTILDSATHVLAESMGPRIAARLFSRLLGFGPNSHIAEDTHPFLWALAQLTSSCACLLITVPVDTVRRRLQAQTRGSAAPIATCVETRRRPYVGVVDCIYSILVEERSDLPLRPKKRRGHERKASRTGKERADAAETEISEPTSWLRNTGIGQLYRGLGMRIGANVILFLLTLFVPTEDADDGWTEL
ncbi:mitochondrial carrier [Schizopora paradoxa]|uniref:Mitochondrial carrier n=1 Tax=Schizopora paradoxa TaxID=27342 RepID=A0A0H2SFA5_9AGAM|nr:mitochondrial carrier [Schizopora paradoxa]